MTDCLGKAYLLLSGLHKIQGKTALALEEHSLSDEITNAFIKEKKAYQIMMHRFNYEKEMNKTEMNVLTGLHEKREEKKERALLLTFLIILILVLIILILFQNIWFKRQKRLNSLQLEKMKSTYFTKISEEFKISASIIIGLVERLKKNLQNKNNDYATELNMLARQSENLFLLINGISSFDNLQEDIKSSRVVNSNIISYLRYLYECFAPMAETKKIDYVFHSNVSEIYMDYKPEYLRMVMHSLLYVAFKFCTEYNHIEVSVNCDNKKNHYTIEISYSRKTTEHNNSPHVLHSFFQEDNGYTTDIGLKNGLQITKNLIEKMKGTFTINGDLLNGALFTVNLPAHHNRTSPSEEEPITIHKQTEDSNQIHIPDHRQSQVENKDKPVVLIVGENRDMNYYLTSVLKDKYILLTEKNGEDAIKTAQGKIPDLVISDTMLPLLDGFQLCKEIKNSLATNHIPVILLALNHTKEERIKGTEYGADAFLSKPVYEEELLVVMDQLLSTRKQLREKYSPFLRINANHEEKNDASNNSNLEFLQRVTSQIYKEITNTENIIEKISSEVCLSSSQLNRKIKAITGTTTSNYILKTRLNRAKKLLALSQKPIGDIATECGFNDFAYFSRSFKKEFGMTPTTFQRIPRSAD